MSQATPPSVTAVMPVKDVAPYVEQAVRSVLGQEGITLQLIVVDDGSTDETPAILARLAAEDDRLVVLQQEHAGQGAARNLAVARAAGPYLVFVDGDDVVPPGSYARMAGALETSGSDICLGAVERFDTERVWQAPWSQEVHARELIGVRLRDRPVLVKDILACNRMIRLEFWRDRGISFPERGVYEDHLPMLRALVEARAIDVLTEVVYRWRARPDHTSTGQQKHELSNLLDRAQAKREAWAYLAEAEPAVGSAWLGRVLDVDLPAYLALAGEADDEYRAALSELVATYADQADDDALRWVRAQYRVRARLAADGRWAEHAAYVAAMEGRGVRQVTRLEDGEVRLDPTAVPLGDVEDRWRTLSAWQTTASARLTGLVRDEQSVRLEGAVAIGGLRLGEYLDTCEVSVQAAGRSHPARVRHRGAKPGGASVAFEVTLDELPADVDELRVVVEIDGLRRSSRVRDPDDLLGVPPVRPAAQPPRPAPQAERPGSGVPLAEIARRHGLRQVGVRPPLGRYIGEVWRRRDFVRVLAQAHAYAEHSNLYLGQLWSVLKPILDATVYVLIFGYLLDTKRGMENVVGFIVVGTFFYRAFNESVTAGAKSIARNLNLVRSLQFPRVLLPLSQVSAEFLSLVPALGVMVGFVLASGVMPSHPAVVVSWKWLLLPVAALLLFAFSLGVGLIVARVAAFVPDLLNTLPFLLRILLYASGVIFSIEHIVTNPTLSAIMKLQPVAVYLDLARQSVLVEPTIPFDWATWLIGLGWAILFLVTGFLFFWRAEARYGRE